MFEIWQGINPMGLGASLADYKTIIHEHKTVTKIIKMKQDKTQGIDPMGLCTPWADSFINNPKIINK